MTDAYPQNTQVLFHMEGANNSTTIANIPHRVLAYANNSSMPLKTTQYKFGSTSLYCDGQARYISYGSNGSDFYHRLLYHDFTIEFWVYILNGGHGGSSSRMFSSNGNSSTGNLQIRCTASDNPCKLEVVGYRSSAYFTICASAGTVSNDAWHHIALVRANGVFTLFVDGVTYSTGTPSPAYEISNNNHFIGSAVGDNPFYGYIDEFRLTNYVARYTGDFTAPTAAFDDPARPTAKVLRRNVNSQTVTTAHRSVAAGLPFEHYRITGTVDRLGVPGPYRVHLVNRKTGKLVDATMSDVDGNYTFRYIPYLANGYYAVAFDNNATPLNADIEDLVTPELMT